MVFMEHIDDYVKDAWDIKPGLMRRIDAFKEECIGNFPFEWKCITACEGGDIFGTYAAAFINFGSPNLAGYFIGVGTGLLYASRHVSQDAKKHDMIPSKKDIAIAVLSAELGCTTMATLVPAIIGAVYGVDFSDPTFIEYAKDFGLRSLALIPAIPAGLIAMSALTLPQKSEVGRLVTKKDELYHVADALRDDYWVEDNRNKRGSSAIPTVIVRGENSKIKIREETLPVTYQNEFDPEINSLYRVFAPTGKYSDVAKTSAKGLTCDVFKKIGLENHVHVKDPFAHDHSSEGDSNHSH